MGSVFEAEDTGLGRRVALKLLHPHVAERTGAARRFLREGRAAARIAHPHVVQVLALGSEGDTPYLAMELLDHGNLSDLIASKGALPVADTLDLLLPVIAAIAAAHDAGVIHRDLKPSNVCIAQGPAGRPWPKVVDFGVSKVVSAPGGNEATVTDAVIGTAAYMAPEQARAARNASFSSDQYSLAVMLYQCVTGELPFGGRSLYEVFQSVMSAPVRPPSTRAKDVPRALDEVVLRGMSRNPRDRFPTVRTFGAALLQFASERSRAAYSAELRFDEAVNSAFGVVSDTTNRPLSIGMATPLDNSMAPPTERSDAERKPERLARHAGWLESTAPPTERSDAKRKPQRLTRHAGWVAVAALMAAAIAITNASRLPRNHVLPPRSDPPSAPAARLQPSLGLARQIGLESVVDPHEPTPSHSSISPVSAASTRTVSPTPARVARTPRPMPAVSFGDNGAPILP
jgi:serine/threonine protein kinase